MNGYDRPRAVPVSTKDGYALLLRLSEGHRLKIGRLGAFEFPEGHYLYFASCPFDGVHGAGLPCWSYPRR